MLGHIERMYEVEKKEIKRCKKLKINNPSIKMFLTRNPCKVISDNNIVKACNEVAAVFITNEDNLCIENSICINSKKSGLISISYFNEHVDPMIYPLMMPYEDVKWSPNFHSENVEHEKMYQYCNIIRLIFK